VITWDTRQTLSPPTTFVSPEPRQTVTVAVFLLASVLRLQFRTRSDRNQYPVYASGFPENGVITWDTCRTLSPPATFVSQEPNQTVIVAVAGVPPGLSTPSPIPHEE
jgi:hypothetical protein